MVPVRDRMRVELFDFPLPSALIAQAPAEPREAARLLEVRATGLADRRIAELPRLLQPGDLLVLNDSRVLPTRFWTRRGLSAIEITLVSPDGSDRWWALARPARRLRPGDRLELAPGLDAVVAAKRADGAIGLRFGLGGAALIEAIKAKGAMPLPPYIKRPRGGDPRDLARYQPVFAARDGSIAAPTASLHLTPGLLGELARRGVATSFVTLHVGLGTFQPVKVADTATHLMHPEWYEIPETSAVAVAGARAAGRRVVAVGTTVLRALESAALQHGTVAPGCGETRLFVTPGFRFAVVDRLLTNFHLPRSTLFMLVCAFAGLERMQAAYRHAIDAGYRFFSYGDATLLERAAGADGGPGA